MKKLILASTIAALSMTAAHAAPTVYGKAGFAINYMDTDNSSEVVLNNKDTRLGVKGGEKITANTMAMYQLEYALATDESQGLVSRDTFVGLQNANLGTLKVGRLSTVDDAVDFSNPADGAVGGTVAAIDESRWDNSVVYATPNYDGLQFMAQYAIDNTGAASEDAFGIAGRYVTGPISAGASYIDTKTANAMRVSAALALSPVVSVSALYQITDFENDNSDKENALTIAGTYDVMNTPWDMYAQFDATNNVGGNDKSDVSKISAGANYAFTKATTGGLYFGVKEEETNDVDTDALVLGAKIVHSF